ncbi:MobF family relaxase [Frankia tisae]|uniref:MobF family relaxase n=1 Tax=Frankia tisae TaxID=2950104 RepID=UPI0021C1C6AF|nr:MobF family relaxase [Frankia tisae]
MKVLGLRAAAGATVAGAVWRIVDYLHGGTPGEAARSAAVGGTQSAEGSGLARYYTGGVARGSAAALVGLRPGAAVPRERLARLLAGQHATSGRPLVPATGSAGRAAHSRRLDGGRGSGEWLSLPEAARIAGVSARYLRRLAARTSRDDAGTVNAGASDSAARPAADDDGTDAGPGRDRLAAAKDSAGRWRVHRDELARFLEEREPPTVVLGFDVTASAPKSVSLLWAFGDDDMRHDIAEAMNVAVDAAIGYLERQAGVGLVDGHNRPGVGLAGVSFLHDISRAEEPHLHIHTVLANAVPIPLLDEDGEPLRDGSGRPRMVWRTVDSELLHAHVKTAGYTAASVLRHELSARRGLRWGPVRNGVAELAGLPADLLAVFSSRRAQIDAELAELVAGGATDGPALREAVQRGTRAPKRAQADAEIRAAQRARLEAAGWTAADVLAAGARTDYRPAAISPDDLDELAELLTGPDGLTARSATFTVRDVAQAVAAWGVDRLDATDIDRLTAHILADPRLAMVDEDTPRRRRDPEPVYTTLDLLDAEDNVLALCEAGRTAYAGREHRLIGLDELEAALAGHVAPRREYGAGHVEPRRGHGAERAEVVRGDDADQSASALVVPEVRVGTETGTTAMRTQAAAVLSVEQVDAVRALLTSTDLVRVLVGPAGSGKTEAMRLLVAVLRDAGRTVLGAAHGGRQTEELTDRLGVDGRVVAGWLTLLDHADWPADVWSPGTILILDEATHVTTRDAARLLRYATETGTVVLALGDPAQLGAIGPGGWFAHLAATLPDVATLATVHRQAGAGMNGVRAALAGLRAGAPDRVRRAMARLAADGRLHRFHDRTSLLAAIVEDWHDERTAVRGAATGANRARGDAASGADHASEKSRRGADDSRLADLPRMMAGDHGTVEWLNRAAQLRRIQANELDPDLFLEVAGRRFHVGDEVITLTQAGHTLIPAGRPASAYIRTGTIGTVTAIDPGPAADRPDGRTLTVDFPGKGSVSIGWDYVTHVFPDGRDGGLTHAYAITAHKAQGSTMATARAVVTDRTSRTGLYVMLSRARTDLAAYLIDSHELTAPGDTEDLLPVVPARGDPLDRLAGHLAASRTDRLVQALDPDAAAVARLRRQYTLAELTALRRRVRLATGGGQPSRTPSFMSRPGAHDSGFLGADGDPISGAISSGHGAVEADRGANGAKLGANSAGDWQSSALDGDGNVIDPVVLARAERSAEVAVAAASLADPPASLLDRIGPRPAGGPARRAWDDAVAGLAIYQARHAAHLGPGDPGPPPPDDHDGDVRHRWEEQHDLAAALVEAWASALHPTGRPDTRGLAAERATAAVHALLDAGSTPAALSRTLAAIDRGAIRDGLAIVDHRLARLCATADVDPAAYVDPPPSGACQDWQRALHLLDRAEIHHLANRPTADLESELWALRSAGGLPAAAAPGDAQGRRAQLLGAALGLQADAVTLHSELGPHTNTSGHEGAAAHFEL